MVPLAVAASLAVLLLGLRRGRDGTAFFASCAFLAAMLAGVAGALYPRLLPASTSDANSLTVFNSASGAYSLESGIYCWSAGMAVAIGYFVLVSPQKA